MTRVHGVYDSQFGAMRAAAEADARLRGGECLTATWVPHNRGASWSLPDGEAWIVDAFQVQADGRRERAL